LVTEQLARLGFGEMILIDFDAIERRNLNRIVNASRSDCGRLKVEVMAQAIRRHRPECHVVAVPHALGSREIVLAAADADLIFSCVDSAEGRHIADASPRRSASRFSILA
jgi:molybdopterin/thiamine biosynthesis adenylyltransferase